MNILITGGAGYVGTSLIPLLLENGFNVKVFDNLSFGGNQLLPFFSNRKFSFVKGDILNKDELKDALKGQDVVIHLAAIVGYPACQKNPQLAKRVNIDGTKNVSSLTSKDQLILFGSTGSNYGAVSKLATEETPLNPLSLYGETKAFAEKYLLDNNKTISYRFATAFGISPRLRLDLLINDFAYKAVSEGYLVIYEKHFMRTFIHVRDMARSFLFALNNVDKMKNDVFNVGSEKMNFSKQEICDMIIKKTDAYIHYADVGEDKDKRNYVVSYEKINTLGFETTITVEEGIDELLSALNVVQFQNPYINI